MSTVETLQQQLQALQARVDELEAISAIERLQRIYGYYLDNRMWQEVLDLFAEDGEIEIGRRGIYRGRAQLRTFLFDVLGGGRVGRAREELHNHIQLQGVVTLGKGADTARGRFRALAQFAMAMPDGSPGSGWAEGVYENEYARRDGLWCIRVLRWMPSFYGRLPPEAIAAGRPSAPASERLPPSAPPTYAKDETGSFILPFHYPHPITGKPTPIGS